MREYIIFKGHMTIILSIGAVLDIVDQFNLNEEDYKIIPFTWCPTSFHTITFEGWKKNSFDFNDQVFSNIIELASKTLNLFIDFYKNTHAFSQPIFCLKPDGTFYIKIGMMTNDLYEDLKKRLDQHDLL